MSIVQDRSSIVGALSPETTTVKLWPYAPGFYGRDALYRVWLAMEEAGDTQRAFWDRAMWPEIGGDLASFIKAFDGVPTTVLLLVEGPPAQQLIGCLWLSELIKDHQAFLSIWMSKSGRPYAREASKQAIDYAFTGWNLAQLWAITPWAGAANLARRMGFERVAVLPDYCRFPETNYDVTVLRLTKARWGNGVDF